MDAALPQPLDDKAKNKGWRSRAQLSEIPSQEGVKQVLVELAVRGLSDGKHPFHSGDLINIDVHGGYGVLLTLTSRVTLSPGPLSIFDKDGSALIIHDKPDTYCPNGEVADCAGGGRAACGIIAGVDK